MDSQTLYCYLKQKKERKIKLLKKLFYERIKNATLH